LSVGASTPLRSETKGQVGACPDRTRAIPCKLLAVTGYSRADDMPLILLTDLLTTALDGSGWNWSNSPPATPTSRPVGQLRTDLDGPNLATDLKVGGMREEVWVASPEPAVGVFTTAGTCQRRLRRHFVIQSREVCFVIGYAAP
jgi:hypothetical protein